MHKKFQRIIIIFFVISLSSCGNDNPQPNLNDKLNFNESEYLDYFKDNLLKSDSLSYPQIKYLDTLKYFYAAHNFQPAFITSFEKEKFLDSLLTILSKAGEHGLDPGSYNISKIRDEFGNAVKDTNIIINRYEFLANAELYAADAVLKYAYHLRYGVVNPVEIFQDSYYFPYPDSSQRELFRPLEQENMISYLQEIEPKSARYKNLQSALNKFRNINSGDWHPVKTGKKKIVPKDKDSSFIGIAERLISLGFLDTSKVFIHDFSVYDTSMVPAVKMFQKMHGLNQDGVIGSTTIERFNLKPSDYINKIKVSLERFRWLDYENTKEYILVNIPDFNLYVIRDGEVKFNSKVCTGRKRSAYYESQYEVYKKNKNWRSKPDDWETPVMTSEISYMVLNPTWTVPATIIREEIAGGLRRDSLYFRKKNFKVFRGGREIDPSEVKTNELSGAYIPYSIVQNPGYLNALGKIKFMFNNPFGIYLHDTPSKAAFNADNRAVSHGCVRVEKPLTLSEFVLEHQSKWNIDYLKAEIGSPAGDKSKLQEYYKIRSELRKGSSYGQTTEVKLEQKVPLFIDYYTAWADKEGNMNFRDDVYKKDKKILEAMK